MSSLGEGVPALFVSQDFSPLLTRAKQLLMITDKDCHQLFFRARRDHWTPPCCCILGSWVLCRHPGSKGIRDVTTKFDAQTDLSCVFCDLITVLRPVRFGQDYPTFCRCLVGAGSV